MYRLVLYYLLALLLVAAVLSSMGMLSFTPLALMWSGGVIVGVCWLTNKIFASAFGAPTNAESVYISAFILTLIITPSTSLATLSLLVWSSVWAMASKYIVAIRKAHLFNPAAFGVAICALALGQSASWWVGTGAMAPFVIIGGLLVVRKIQRFDMVLTFFIAALASIAGIAMIKGNDGLAIIQKALLHAPLLFFAFVMLTEPLTTPPTRALRIDYGLLTGFLFAPQLHIASIYSTPELALLVGNIFSYLVSPREKFILTLNKKIPSTPTAYDFLFPSQRRLAFLPGQYLEWTLAHRRPDSRGNRRYFTIASSPTEKEIRLGVKFYENASSFKKTLLAMKEGESRIVASQAAGDFILPRDANKKLVFIAGGIGITPFRSMLQYCIDTNQKRDIVLFYANKTARDIMYEDVFRQARQKIGIKTVYVVSDQGDRVTECLIKEQAPDYQERAFYVSGPRSMVVAFQETLRNMGVARSRIKTDFFPGFA